MSMIKTRHESEERKQWLKAREAIMGATQRAGDIYHQRNPLQFGMDLDEYVSGKMDFIRKIVFLTTTEEQKILAGGCPNET